jgi:hypothetical protein
MPDPVGNAERAELGEIAVIENENEMRRLVAETFEHMGMPAWKVPNIAWRKIVCFRLPRWINYRRPNTTFQHQCPFGCSGVPVKFAHCARFKLHRHARDPFGDRQLLDRCFFPETVPQNFPF